MAELKNDTFVVMKKSDLDILCQKSPEFATKLRAVIREYVDYRIATRGHAEDKYLVCNCDETYADEVSSVILNGERREDKDPQVKIKSPIALRGDSVMVLNYRTRPSSWEGGEVLDAEYQVSFGNDVTKGRWHYRVRLMRKSPKGKSIIVYVGDDGLTR